MSGWAQYVLGFFAGMFLLGILMAGFFTLPERVPETPTVETPREEPNISENEPVVTVETEEKDEDIGYATPIPEKPAEPAVVETIQTITKTLTTPVDPVPLNIVNDIVRGTVVNILCSSSSGGTVSSITGSGVIIDPKGVILTNAHVAQYFLLKNYPAPGFVNCIIRTGSPAYPTYTAELLFMHPAWVSANAEKIDDESPMGNGEHDYALLLITGAIDQNRALPSVFPHLPFSATEVSQGNTIVIAGYPAGLVGSITVAKDLYAASSITTVGTLYTYATSSADVFSVGGSVVAQQGSSGGAVADTAGNLVGLIVTSTITPDTASRDLHALATSYIARDFETARSVPLSVFFERDLRAEARIFSETVAPGFTAALVTVLEKE